MTGSNLTSGTFYDGSNRNYSYLYDKSKYTSLWIAYPLDKSTCTGSNKYSGTMVKAISMPEATRFLMRTASTMKRW